MYFMLALYEIKTIKINEKLLCCAGIVKFSKSNGDLVIRDRQVKQTESLIENSSSLTVVMRITVGFHIVVFSVLIKT